MSRTGLSRTGYDPGRTSVQVFGKVIDCDLTDSTNALADGINNLSKQNEHITILRTTLQKTTSTKFIKGKVDFSDNEVIKQAIDELRTKNIIDDKSENKYCFTKEELDTLKIQLDAAERSSTHKNQEYLLKMQANLRLMQSLVDICRKILEGQERFIDKTLQTSSTH